MEPPPTVAEQRATAVAWLKRAASLPRMKDGRRPPMHVEAVSEGERVEKPDEESAQDSDEKPDTPEAAEAAQPEVDETAAVPEEAVTDTRDGERQVDGEEKIDCGEDKPGDAPPSEGTSERSSTPSRKRRSRSRARSRGSKDLRNKAKTPPPVNNESSADEYGVEDPPPSPPLISPIPTQLVGFQPSRFLRSPMTPFYPMTSPSTPMMPPSLDEIQKGIGLFRSNSVGAARMLAMQKLTGEPADVTFGSPIANLTRNNTVSGGERGDRVAARKLLLQRLGGRVEKADVDQTSGGEELSRPVTPGTSRRRKRRSRRSSSRASTVLDDRDDGGQPSTSPNTPLVPPSPLPFSMQNNASPMFQQSRGTPVQHLPPEVSMPMGGRGVVIEDEDEDADRQMGRGFELPSTPARRPAPRLPHSSDAPSQGSTDYAPTGIPVPFYLSTQPAPYKQDVFPASPYPTPSRGTPYVDEDEESDTYREALRAPNRIAFERDSEISWVADEVPRMPINDDDDEDNDEDEDEEEAEEELGREVEREPEVDPEVEAEADAEETTPIEHVYEHRPSDTRSSQTYYPPSIDTSASKNLVIEVETSPELSPSYVPPSPSSAMALSAAVEDHRAEVPSRYPMRLSVASPVQQLEHSPSTTDFPEWDDGRNESAPKRGNENFTPWERLQNIFTRSNSSGGRRSRTNSISARDRRYNTDSSVSRESGASLNGGQKGDRTSEVVQQHGPLPLMQSPSASTSITSLAPQTAPPPGGLSPVPPVTSADLAKYADSKLFPFPGMQQLQEKRNRAKGIGSASSPDILSPNAIENVASGSSSSSATTKSPEGARDRKLSHQASDTRLLSKFAASPVTSVPSSGSHTDYFSVQSSTSTSTAGTGGARLPTNREGVRKWLSAKKLFSPSTPSTPSTPAPVAPVRPAPAKKPSLSDLRLLITRKDPELSSDWEEVGSDKSRTPTSANSMLKRQTKEEAKAAIEHPENVAPGVRLEAVQSPRLPTNGTEVLAFPSPPEPPSSTTPDPQSSLDGYRSTSESSELSSSPNSPEITTNDQGRAAIIMERLDEVLGRGSKSSIWPIAIDDPPRKLVLSSPVLQVANANTVKDRFLFLFNDIVVIAKPVVQDQDALLEGTKPTPLDRKFIVKSVVLLRDLKFSADREESRANYSLNASHMRNQVVRTFVQQFGKDPDQAIGALFDKAKMRDDPIALGQLLFRTVDLDRVRLGEYLSRRTSKVVLKAYVDSFGFAGLRIDKALRVFLLSICIPPKAALDYLLDAFASRWYEANAGIVAYDKDLAVRLVRAVVQLNEVMHGGIASTPGSTGYPKRNVISRDFVEAFRRYDSRGLVSDDLLDKIYAAIRRERLSQARNQTNDRSNDVLISVKRPLPPRLTYRIQSEPIILRIPQPDKHLTIQLFGQDLLFEPTVLSFEKSAEQSFRVTGTSLGPKTIIMWRSGPNALVYSGLSLSSPVMVERAFMRNTFQMAFQNHLGEKRRYMFSVDDPLVRHQWVVSLKRQIELASAPPPSAPMAGPSVTPSPMQKAVEAVALRVLQETLVSSEDPLRINLFPSAVDHALARLNGDAAPSGNGFLQAKAANHHRRSKSRSQVYHRQGAGKLEPDATDTEESDGFLRIDNSSSARSGDTLWSAAELEVVCRQNSSLPSVLAYLHVEGPEGVAS